MWVIAQAEAQMVSLAVQYGVPLVLLMALVYSLRQAAVWAGVKVIEPLAAKHMEFLDSTRSTMEQQATAATQTARTLEALQEHQQVQTQTLEQIRSQTSMLACVRHPG